MCAENAGGSKRCFRCGARFADGAIRYRVDIRVAADTGGEATIEELEGELKRLMEVIEGKSPDELEREVHSDYRFFLCKSCKDEYLAGPEIPLDKFFFGE